MLRFRCKIKGSTIFFNYICIFFQMEKSDGQKLHKEICCNLLSILLTLVNTNTVNTNK